MSQNDFYVAIQAVLMAAHERGWSTEWVEQNALDAVAEWVEETSPALREGEE